MEVKSHQLLYKQQTYSFIKRSFLISWISFCKNKMNTSTKLKNLRGRDVFIC
jgi:hypothetical protein